MFCPAAASSPLAVAPQRRAIAEGNVDNCSTIFILRCGFNSNLKAQYSQLSRNQSIVFQDQAV